MSTWDQVRSILAELRDDPRRPLQVFPDPDANDARPPYRIEMQAWASGMAAELHDRFGTEVDLVVGRLHYPERRLVPPSGAEPAVPPEADYPLLPAHLVEVSLDQPVVVPSGHSTRSALRLHNQQDRTEVLVTNGQLTARVLDPRSGEVVGGYSGLQTMPLVTFEIPAGSSRTVPLLVGTASAVGELGYAIPPGQWWLDAVVVLRSGQYRVPPLPLTITDEHEVERARS